MPTDPLDTVLRLRRRAVEDCRRMLASSLATAHSTELAARAADQAILDETDAACAIDADDAIVEAFAAWWPSGCQRAAQARIRQENAEAEVARSRAQLTVCQSALETIEHLQNERIKAAEQIRSHREQLAIDEAALNTALNTVITDD